MKTEEFVSLETLGRGAPGEACAAVDLFNLEFGRALENIMDPNTAWKTKRRVVLTVTLSPDEERESCIIEIAATSKLAPVRPHPTQVFLGKDKGRAVAVEHDPKQMNVFRQIEEEKLRAAENVVHLKSGGDA